MTDDAATDAPNNKLAPFVAMREAMRKLGAEHGMKLIDANLLFQEKNGVLRIAFEQIPVDPGTGDADLDAAFADLVKGFNDQDGEDKAAAQVEREAKSAEEIRELRRRLQGGKGIL